MFKKVVWATDGSDYADQALTLAKTLVVEGGGELVAIHCQELTLPGKGGGRLPVYANEDELRDKIEGQVSEISKDGVRAHLHTASASVGGAAHVIAEVAGEAGGDVIVVGTRGRTPLGGLLLGSVTQRLLSIAPCPVLAVPAKNAHGSDA